MLNLKIKRLLPVNGYQWIKQKLIVCLLLGVMFVGINDVLGFQYMVYRREGVPPIVSIWTGHFNSVGSLFLTLAPIVLLILDWRNYFPKKTSTKSTQKNNA